MAVELKGMRTRGWNYYHPLVFAAIIIPTEDNVRYSKYISAHIERQIEPWYKYQFTVLVYNTVNDGVHPKTPPFLYAIYFE